MRIDWTPVEIENGCVEDEAERYSWGTFSIRVTDAVGERCLTRVEHVTAKFLGDGVTGPLVPIAEWFAANWWHIVKARRAPVPDAPRRVQYAWRRVRTLSYVGDGLPLPVLTFEPAADGAIRLRCAAEPAAAAWARVRFIESCDVCVESAAVKEAVRGFVEGILDRLRQTCPASDRFRRLERLWRTATDPTDPQHELYVRTGQAGERWGSVPEDVRRILEGLPRRGQAPLLDAVVERVPPGELGPWVLWAGEAWEAARSSPVLPPDAQLARIRAAVAPIPRPTRAKAWHQGWEDARCLRRALGLADAERTELPRLDPTTSPLLAPREAALAWCRGREPRRFSGPDPSPFQSVRDVHPAIFVAGTDGDADGARLHSTRVVGSPSVANAFAAEWLAPVHRVRAVLGERTVADLETVVEIAQELDAPVPCVQHQIVNHELAQIVSV